MGLTFAEIEKIKQLALDINEDTKNVRFAADQLAQEFQKELVNPSHSLTIDAMTERYQKRNEMFYLSDTQSEQGFRQIIATGATPINPIIKNRLLIIEYLYPKISVIYQKFKYVDEVWYLDMMSVAGGNTEKNILSRIKPGFDIGGEFARGEKPYSRFGIIGPEQNPQRKCRWSPDAFIELFDELVVSAQSPVFMKDNLVGKVSIHYNLTQLSDSIITNSPLNLLLISHNSTLIGSSPGVQKIIQTRPYQKKIWDSPKAKMEYVRHDLNMGESNPDFYKQLLQIKPGFPGKLELLGGIYNLYRFEISEIGFELVLIG